MGATASDLSWHDVRDMAPTELADVMVRVCGNSFEKYHDTIVDRAVGGGIVCSLGEQPLRSLLMDTSITFKPHQDVIIQALDELRRNTEASVAALEKSGSPYTFTVVRALRTHNAAYITFTKEGDTFRGATKFAKSLRRTLDSAWDPPNAPVTVRLRGSETLGATSGPLLGEVAKSLNLLWLLSASSLEDPFCLMEVCTAVRQGVPVIPIRLAGKGMPQLEAPIWPAIKETPTRDAPGHDHSIDVIESLGGSVNHRGGDAGVAEDGEELELRADGNSAAGGRLISSTETDTNDVDGIIHPGPRLDRHATDAFYAQLAQRLPKSAQEELHRNRFLVKDVFAAVRACFERVGGAEFGASPVDGVWAAAKILKATSRQPPASNLQPAVFNLSEANSSHREVLGELIGLGSRVSGRNAQGRERKRSQWNWELLPETAAQAGRVRGNKAVPWRTEDEISELIREEGEEADDLAGLLIKRMVSNPGSENHQWEGCKGLADLAARDSDGLSAVRRQGGVKAVLAALEACPVNPDVQRWGCQVLIPLFGDPVVAAAHRQAGIVVVIRALATLEEVERAMKEMGASATGVSGGGKGGESTGAGGVGGQSTAIRDRWARAIKKVEVGRVKQQRRASQQALAARNEELEREEAELKKIIQENRRRSQQGLGDETPESIPADSAAQQRGKGKGKKRLRGKSGGHRRRDSGDSGALSDDALAEEQRLLEEKDRLEHEAEKARQKREENRLWAMSEADLAVYDAAFVKLDKDKDGFISPQEAKSMFAKARTSEDARRRIWEMCDPNRRGKLTRHGWRVAYHLARSVKTRKMVLPATLPLCLYPPGAKPVVQEEKTRGGPLEEYGVAATGKVDRIGAETGGSEEQGEGSAPANVGEGVRVAGNLKQPIGVRQDKKQTKKNDAQNTKGVDGGRGVNVVVGASAKKTKVRKAKGKDKSVSAVADSAAARSSSGSKSGKGALEATKNDGEKGAPQTTGGSAGAKGASVAATSAIDLSPTPVAKAATKKGGKDDSAAFRMSSREKARYEKEFDKLVGGGNSGKNLGAKEAAAVMAKSGLGRKDLGRIWTLADADRDGELSRHEFAVAMHLAACVTKKGGPTLPRTLPQCLVIAGKRGGGGETAVTDDAGLAVTAMAGRGQEADARSVSTLECPEGLSDGGGSERAMTTGGKFNGDEPQEGMELPSWEERDKLYAMSALERAGYDIIFMQIDLDDSGKVDSREASSLLLKGGLTREDVSAIWAMAGVDGDGELTHAEWTTVMHLARCVTKKNLALPKILPEVLGGPGPSARDENRPAGSKARQEEQRRSAEKKAAAARAVSLRDQIVAYKLGKISAAALYMTLAQVFGIKRNSVVPKIALSLPLEKARALLAAAGLGEDVLQENGAAELKLQQLRRRRLNHASLNVKVTTSGATVRDVQLAACRLGNRLCATLDEDSDGSSVGGGAGRGSVGASRSALGARSKVAVAMASGGGVAAVTRLLRVFDASDLELMVDALSFALTLARGCAAVAIRNDSFSDTSSLMSSHMLGSAEASRDQAEESESLLLLLRTLYAPSVCRRVTEIAKASKRNTRAQRLCCLLVDELGVTCGAPARRCFAECCEPILVAVAGDLDELIADVSDENSLRGGSNDDQSMRGISDFASEGGVREAACRALATLAQEPGLSRRLAAMRAGQALTRAMEAAPQNRQIQLSCLESVSMLAENDPSMWSDGSYNDRDEPPEVPAIDAPSRMAVKSAQTFAIDSTIHRAASRAILALLSCDSAGNAGRSVATAGGAATLCRILATSPTAGDIQRSTVLAIAELLEGCEGKIDVLASTENIGASPRTTLLSSTFEKVEEEVVAAAGCELLCKSAKAFPRDRKLRLGCLRAMAALCRGAGANAVERLVGNGVCEQLMKIVDGCPGDMEVRRTGLALVVGIAENGDGACNKRIDGETDGQTTSIVDSSSSAEAAAVINRLGLVGAVAFVAAWLREATAPAWAWAGVVYGDSSSEERARDLLMSCQAVFLLSQHSSINKNRFVSMGAAEALSRAIALSGRSNDVEDDAIDARQELQKERDQERDIRAETQVWAAKAVAELAGGHEHEDRCNTLVRAGALRALFAAMNRRPTARHLHRAGCLTLGNVAACFSTKDLQILGKNGGAQAVVFALRACSGDKSVAWAGLLAVAKLSVSSGNRRLLGEVGACLLVSKVLLEFSDDEAIAEEGCRAIAGLAALSGYNRTALGRAGAAEATTAALQKHPAKPMTQRWGLSAAASLIADTDPSGNTSKITDAGILNLAEQALTRFPQNPSVQTEGLRTFAKVATSGDDGADAVWAAGVVIPTVRALGLYLNDGDVQHWGMATVRALTGIEEQCAKWRAAGAPEAVARALHAFREGGSGRHIRHDELGKGRPSDTRLCTADESLGVQLQACAAALNLAAFSPDGRRRLVREGAGEALAVMMKSNPANAPAQRAALASLAALSTSGAENRKRLRRYKGGVPQALVSALELFPNDRRVRCEGTLTVQNLSFTEGGARVLAKAGVAPVIIRLLQAVLVEAEPDSETGKETNGRNAHVLAEGSTNGGERLDREVMVYLLNGLANLVAVDDSLSDFVGKHGACETVVSVLQRWPRDLQLQASGVKSVRALALCNGRNVDVLAAVQAPTAIARAQNLFLRDREVQLACLGAAEALCRGGNRTIATTLVDTGCLSLLESSVDQFAGDAEFVAQGLRTLVEIALCDMVVVKPSPKPTVQAGATAKWCENQEGEILSRPSSLPVLEPNGDQITGDVIPVPVAKRLAGKPRTTATAAAAAPVVDASRAVGIVLAVMERNSCREVCFSAFAALRRLLAVLDATDSTGVTAGAGGKLCEVRSGSAGNSESVEVGLGGAAARVLQWVKVGHAVKRALKVNRRDDNELAASASKVLALVAAARGRELAQ